MVSDVKDPHAVPIDDRAPWQCAEALPSGRIWTAAGSAIAGKVLSQAA